MVDGYSHMDTHKGGREAYEEFELLPRLKFATKEQREAYELNYFGIHWDEIDEVNIGAFPLRPKDEENRRLLDEFVAKLLTTRANALLTQGNIIPQKGLRYEHDEKIMGSDDYCIVCYTPDWLVAEVFNAGIYYTRTGDKRGALPFDIKAATARRILLLPFKGNNEAILFEVMGDGPSIYTGNKLKEKGFAHIKEGNEKDPYMAYQINPVPIHVKQESLIVDSELLKYAKVNQQPVILRINEIVMPNNGSELLTAMSVSK